jgi:hypothetical protein
MARHNRHIGAADVHPETWFERTHPTVTAPRSLREK